MKVPLTMELVGVVEISFLIELAYRRPKTQRSALHISGSRLATRLASIVGLTITRVQAQSSLVSKPLVHHKGSNTIEWWRKKVAKLTLTTSVKVNQAIETRLKSWTPMSSYKMSPLRMLLQKFSFLVSNRAKNGSMGLKHHLRSKVLMTLWKTWFAIEQK